MRLLVFFLEDAGSALAVAAQAAAAAVVRALPPSARVHTSPRYGLHMTLFMMSQPFDLTPDPFGDAEGGGGDGGADSSPPDALGTPARGVVEREVAAAAAIASSIPPPTLVAHSILLAPSGVLLLVLTEKGDAGVVGRLRARARAAFPTAPPKQPSIMHVTLGRVLSPLGVEEAAAAAAAAAAASDGVRGLEWAPAAVSHVCETLFATVAGPRVDAVCGGGERKG